jgi:hypothetical protein
VTAIGESRLLGAFEHAVVDRGEEAAVETHREGSLLVSVIRPSYARAGGGPLDVGGASV